jgi:carboxymethylenebutenolidase
MKTDQITAGRRQPLKVGHRVTTMHLALPASPARAGVIVLHPWWGLNDDVTRYADRLAEAGFAAGAPDLYAGQIATTIPEAEALGDSLDEDIADAFVLAAVDEVGAAVGDPAARLGAVGFSMGAGWALWLPAQRPEVAATVVYYGSMEGPSLTRARTPVLGHFAESDPYETDEGIATFERTLRTANREIQLQRYPGTGHWFAEPSKEAFVPDAAELAFERTVEFLRRHLLDEAG